MYSHFAHTKLDKPKTIKKGSAGNEQNKIKQADDLNIFTEERKIRLHTKIKTQKS